MTDTISGVSIHAPVQGATPESDKACAFSVPTVSIHAPVQGATRSVRANAAWGANLVSIHAPVQGATQGLSIEVSAIHFNGFYPRPRAGGDRCRPRAESALCRLVFLSTPPCRGRLDRSELASDRPHHHSFYPRPRAGGDMQTFRAGMARSRGQVSIHAPVQGATSSGPRILTQMTDGRFLSTPPCRGRHGRFEGRNGSGCRAGFYPRPRAGGDSSGSQSLTRGRYGRVSIHAPVQGATWTGSGQEWALQAAEFLSTPPCRGRLVRSNLDPKM